MFYRVLLYFFSFLSAQQILLTIGLKALTITGTYSFRSLFHFRYLIFIRIHSERRKTLTSLCMTIDEMINAEL